MGKSSSERGAGSGGDVAINEKGYSNTEQMMADHWVSDGDEIPCVDLCGSLTTICSAMFRRLNIEFNSQSPERWERYNFRPEVRAHHTNSTRSDPVESSGASTELKNSLWTTNGLTNSNLLENSDPLRGGNTRASRNHIVFSTSEQIGLGHSEQTIQGGKSIYFGKLETGVKWGPFEGTKAASSSLHCMLRE